MKLFAMSRFVSVGCCPDEFIASRKQEHIKQITERCLVAQKHFERERTGWGAIVSRNKQRETENIGARHLDVLIVNFRLQVREFLFLISVKKTISLTILVFCVINSSRHRKCFVRGYIHSLFLCQKPSLARTSLVRVFTQTTREYNPVQSTFYDVNYKYIVDINIYNIYIYIYI